MGEVYDVMWEKHHAASFDAFVNLRLRESLVDVALFCGGELIQAHKLVLAACSDFFDRLFSSLAPEELGRCSVVALPKIDATLLKLSLDFMYSGKVTVPSEKLDEFMTFADLLEIRGLKSEGPQSNEALDTSGTALPCKQFKGMSFVLNSPKKRSAASTKNSCESAKRMKSDPDLNEVNDGVDCEAFFEDSSNSFQEMDRNEPKNIPASIKADEPLVRVGKHCWRGKDASSRGYSFFCDLCGHVSTWKRDGLRHERKHTGERPFACPECPVSYTRREHLRRHLSSCIAGGEWRQQR
ncbi:unnamed protein product [Notodromas monacha]|uniref:Uncharacterized protein n=1 Tax=Notodromas monacha TaxID=399045 RepID=A0A7R9BHQ5_9CRUS|nr:unnamed protein product [Notodromas monacha]CAG0915708.1 unnamed protein product [Notodromas monacha]